MINLRSSALSGQQSVSTGGLYNVSKNIKMVTSNCQALFFPSRRVGVKRAAILNIRIGQESMGAGALAPRIENALVSIGMR